MKRGEYLDRMIKEKGFTIMSLSKASGVAYTTLRSMIERDLKNASIDNVLKVCKVLGIKADDLAKEEYDELEISSTNTSLPELNSKDEKDIQKELSRMIEGLESKNGYAAFDGHNIEDMDDEDRELLISSLENSLRLAKRLAKQKFTPKKYRN
ncbi:helix-turn-helix domain-containing protein [Metabacillus indicus]|uniref:helix-turn-helix domain-containing protein n=1 Tax=Metabacillus indicus TaxID=246786 RepID=UPI0004936EBF|nr:helix-turn-helix transcriptional regulator [Metabacillus indicus]KEZ51353.1 hypothetical protein AZ46_0212330 [Metabacillus indicus LMG 22858]